MAIINVEKIIYTAKPTQIYCIDKNKDKTGKLDEFLKAVVSEPVISAKTGSSYDGMEVYHYKNATLMVSYSPQNNQIKAIGSAAVVDLLENYYLIPEVKKSKIPSRID